YCLTDQSDYAVYTHKEFLRLTIRPAHNQAAVHRHHADRPHTLLARAVHTEVLERPDLARAVRPDLRRPCAQEQRAVGEHVVGNGDEEPVDARQRDRPDVLAARREHRGPRLAAVPGEDAVAAEDADPEKAGELARAAATPAERGQLLPARGIEQPDPLRRAFRDRDAAVGEQQRGRDAVELDAVPGAGRADHEHGLGLDAPLLAGRPGGLM